MKNPELELAWDFIEKTNRSIFLTGKAGTGKTTFLHKIKEKSQKRLVVVAPTGVAAINAKGVTIHSFFQMPFGPILPERAQDPNQKTAFSHKFNKQKIDIIRSLDLLIIDEISMVRADLLDGIDQVLRRYKNRMKVFGGVQVLMIGDLQQLAPVVKPYEWDMLRTHYSNPYFFSSKAFQEANTLGIELKHIYRQDDQTFIDILNEIRNNQLSAASAKKLNERFQPDFNPSNDAGYITLTTHNNRAQTMNQLELKKIKANSHFYKATVEGKFPPHSYPTFEKLELRLGAQVMFIKNDSNPEKRYFNGKIGKIIKLDGDSLIVRCPNDDFDIEVKEEIWENVKYTINSKTKEIEDDKIGSFSQIPLRLAWAITIHKSQGLTFEKAIIDAEASFAHGQTYVALSRCKTLEGIILKRPITEKSIINDARVSTFTKTVEENLPGQKELDESQKLFQLMLMDELFNFSHLIYPLKRMISIFYANENTLKGQIIEPLFALKDKGIILLDKVSKSFKIQLKNLSIEATSLPEEDKKIQDRLLKGIAYFLDFSKEKLEKPLSEITFSTDNQQVEKDFKKHLLRFEEGLAQKLFALNGLKTGFNTKKFLKIRAQAVFEKVKTKNKLTKKNRVYSSTEHPILFETIRSWRNQIASNEGIPPFHIITQSTLFEICIYLPRTKDQLLAIYGFGKKKLEQYGEEIIALITTYCTEHDASPKEEIVVKKKEKKRQKGETHKISFNLYKKGLSIKEIAAKRDYATSTIEAHLAKFVETGEIPITDLIPEKKYLELKELMSNTKYDSLSVLKQKIDKKFSYFELRLVQKWLG